MPINKNVPMLRNSIAAPIPSRAKFLSSFGVSISLSRK
jgi:hypothetical protein